MQVFNINIEFNPDFFRRTIEEHIQNKEKGYVCVVDGNVIAVAQKNMDYQRIIREATINTCDGSSIAMMVNHIYDTNYHAYNGPEVFEYYIEKPYKHLLLGNTIKKVEQIRSIVNSKGYNIDLAHFDVPFVSVDEFDYKGISSRINEMQPDIIWVSLGAPKQEIFMHKILPYLNSGIMLGIGAAFNFYTGDIHNNKRNIGALRFVWLERILKEPRKQFGRAKRYLSVMPKMYFQEKKKYLENNQTHK